MNTRLIILLLCAPAITTTKAPEIPKFSTPIYLFRERNLTEALNVRARLLEQFPEIEKSMLDTICGYLTKIFTPSAIFNSTGRQVPEIGFDTKRINASITTLHKPNAIVATFSGKETLQETVDALLKARLAHNFLIDRDGSIHQAKLEGESDDDALMHRPFSVGISGFVENGFAETRDMNAQVISIAVVGRDDQPATAEQIQSMIDLVANLSNRFAIKPTHVLDYGRIALHSNQEAGAKSNSNNLATLYGRRKTQANLPWKELAEHKLTLWPRPEDSDNIELSAQEQTDVTIWASMALRKVGLLCPPTHNHEHPDFKGALIAFQEHFGCDNQTGTITNDTIRSLNSILIQHEEWNPGLKDIVPPALPRRKA